MAPPIDAKATREHILVVTANEMRVNGYEATSLADILGKAGLSRGALYHHFDSKLSLGYAVFDEIFIKEFLDRWREPLSATDPIDGLYRWIHEGSKNITQCDLEQGCTMSRIAMEMSDIDEGFRERASSMFSRLSEQFAQALADAKGKNYVAMDVDPESTAVFIVASIQGLMLQGRYCCDVTAFKSGLARLADYIISLRPEGFIEQVS